MTLNKVLIPLQLHYKSLNLTQSSEPETENCRAWVSAAPHTHAAVGAQTAIIPGTKALAS